jgi:hypothetical protein
LVSSFGASVALGSAAGGVASGVVEGLVAGGDPGLEGVAEVPESAAGGGGAAFSSAAGLHPTRAAARVKLEKKPHFLSWNFTGRLLAGKAPAGRWSSVGMEIRMSSMPGLRVHEDNTSDAHVHHESFVPDYSPHAQRSQRKSGNA